jgi:hypothetical protein
MLVFVVCGCDKGFAWVVWLLINIARVGVKLGLVQVNSFTKNMSTTLKRFKRLFYKYTLYVLLNYYRFTSFDRQPQYMSMCVCLCLKRLLTPLKILRGHIAVPSIYCTTHCYLFFTSLHTRSIIWGIKEKWRGTSNH